MDDGTQSFFLFLLVTFLSLSLRFCNTKRKKAFANVFFIVYSCLNGGGKKMRKPINVEMSKTVAEVLSRMIEEEIANQKQWLKEDIEQFGKPVAFREAIINELNEMADDLEAQGFKRYVKA